MATASGRPCDDDNEQNHTTTVRIGGRELVCRALRIVLQHWLTPELGWVATDVDSTVDRTELINIILEITSYYDEEFFEMVQTQISDYGTEHLPEATVDRFYGITSNGNYFENMNAGLDQLEDMPDWISQSVTGIQVILCRYVSIRILTYCIGRRT